MSFRLGSITIPAVAVAVGLVLTLAPTPAGATASPTDYCMGQCNDILAPGENGNATLADVQANQSSGFQPPHFSDQLGPYANLVAGYAGLNDERISQFFNDSSFGVPPAQATPSALPGISNARTRSPSLRWARSEFPRSPGRTARPISRSCRSRHTGLRRPAACARSSRAGRQNPVARPRTHITESVRFFDTQRQLRKGLSPSQGATSKTTFPERPGRFISA
jgi:hypothetical protein